jgi:serine/threonine protein kinase
MELAAANPVRKKRPRREPQIWPSIARERFGKYEIIRRIAVGGMAEIHLARATGLEGFEKLVVIKRVLPQLASNEEFVQWFLDEARLAARLHHSNIVQVYDIGSVDGQYFLSMEFLHGQDLRQITKAVARRKATIPLPHALTIVMNVCAGLQYAHDCVVDGKPLDLVHRDVSPQNVFVTYYGGVKILDFGIARASTRLSQTRVGMIKGKVSYMSPEQCAGLPLDRRSDVFALAIMLWELTVGRRLFGGDTEWEVLKKIADGVVPRPSELCPGYPAALERIVMKGLEHDRERRYASAEALLLDLEAFVRERQLRCSSVALTHYMRDLFRDQVDAWREAERAGVTLADHVAQTIQSASLVRADRPASPPAEAANTKPTIAQLPRRRRRGLLTALLSLTAGSLGSWSLGPVPEAAKIAPPAIAQPAPPPVQPPQPPVENVTVKETANANVSAKRRGKTKPRFKAKLKTVAVPAPSTPSVRAWDPDSMLPP